MLKRAQYAWTPEDEAKLQQMVEQGVFLRNIAVRLKRSESSVKKRAYDLGLTLRRMPRFRADGSLRRSPEQRSA